MKLPVNTETVTEQIPLYFCKDVIYNASHFTIQTDLL